MYLLAIQDITVPETVLHIEDMEDYRESIDECIYPEFAEDPDNLVFDLNEGAALGIPEVLTKIWNLVDPENMIDALDLLESINNWEEEDLLEIAYIMIYDYGYNWREVMSNEEGCREVIWTHDIEKYAEDYFDQCTDVPDHLANYIDYKKFADDLLYGGDFGEFQTVAGDTIYIDNHSPYFG